MEIVNKQTKVDTIRKRWEDQYPPGRDPDKWEHVNKRLIEDPPQTCEEIDELIGNKSWTRIRCYQCDEEKDVVVRVGEEPDYESSTSWICKDCLKIALKMIKDYEKTN